VQAIETGGFEVREEGTRQEKSVRGHAHLAKAKGLCVADQFYNVWMSEWFASLQTEPGDAELRARIILDAKVAFVPTLSEQLDEGSEWE